MNRTLNLFSWVFSEIMNQSHSNSHHAHQRQGPVAMGPALHVNRVPHARAPHDNVYPSDVASNISVEAQDGPSSSTYVVYAPRISYTSLPPVPWTVPGIWTTFKRLELTCPINPNECLLILQDCSVLIEFKLTLVEVERNPEPAVCSPVEARALRSITIKSFCATERLFGFLNLPQLTSVHLSLAPLDEPPTDIGLVSLFSRSQCNLQTLSLTNVFLLERDLIASLQTVTHSLKELVVRNDRSCIGMSNGRMISGHTLQYLTRTGPWPHCPRLTTLELSPCASADGLLARMLASRLPADGFSFAYSFLDPSLHTRDSQYLAVNAGNSRLTHVIHETYT